MSGHSKWAQIKRQKGVEDSKKSKVFGKLGSLIATESRKAGGDINSPGLRMLIEKAKKENMPKDTIDRAVKKGLGNEAETMESLTYEGYGPGGCALMIEAFTGNRNKAAQEIKHILTRSGGSLAAQGAAAWAFTKTEEGWVPNATIPLSDEDGAVLSTIIEDLENNDEVQEVFTNAD
ncbi:MAG: transcriptional regulator [Parcubacteria group bacterium GW2011_GWA2_47_7]|nr:MAG: transcriptional regulator [Parcubacteria group bacterium GW2011_GWA2_47_7]